MKIYVYLLWLDDDTMYIGMTNKFKRRIEDHRKGAGSIWTRGREIVTSEILWQGELINRWQALLVENTWAEKMRKKYFEKTVRGGYLSGRYKKIVLRRALTRT